ncbi:MAG: cobaltochelatase subunit CobN, partial [Moorella sp. (in: Bacteria)]|nr:cobaltochelatase subunit CobN [Moorella sp. (in: firmicutes)]
TVSHASPPVIAADLYGEYLELEELLAEYRKAEGRDKETLAGAIKEKAKTLSLPTEDLAELEVYLYRMKRRLIPKGLHVLDRQLEGEDLIAYLAALARFDREVPSYYRTVAERMGFSYESLAQEPQASAAVDREVHRAIGRWLAGDETALPPEIGRYLAGVKENIARSQESAGLLSVLDGCYLLPNLAGDPVRSPEVYPVGRNMYEFD